MNVRFENTVVMKQEQNGTFSVIEEVHFPNSGNVKEIPRFNGTQSEANDYFNKLVEYRQNQLNKSMEKN